MGFNITVPWTLHQHRSEQMGRRTWWIRRKPHDEAGAHPTMMKEQDLDHLGVLHDAVIHPHKRRNIP